MYVDEDAKALLDGSGDVEVDDGTVLTVKREFKQASACLKHYLGYNMDNLTHSQPDGAALHGDSIDRFNFS